MPDTLVDRNEWKQKCVLQVLSIAINGAGRTPGKCLHMIETQRFRNVRTPCRFNTIYGYVGCNDQSKDFDFHSNTCGFSTQL